MKFTLPKLRSGDKKPSNKRDFRLSMRIRTVWLIGSLVASLVAGGALFYVYNDVAAMHAQSRARTAEDLATNAQLIFEEQLASLRATLDGAAQRSELATLFQDGGAVQATMSPPVAEIAKLFPEASRVILLPTSLAAPLENVQPPVGFAVVEQINAYLQNKTQPMTEMHWLDQGKAYLEILSPVLGDNGAMRGFLLATFPMEVFTKRFDALAMGDAYVEVEQNIPGAGARILFSRGNAGFKQLTPLQDRPIEGTFWHVRVWSDLLPESGSPAHLQYYAMLALGVLAGLLAVFSGLAWIMLLAIRQDCATLLALFKDVLADRIGNNYRAKLSDFQPVLDATLQMVKDGALLSRHVAGDHKPALVKSKARFELEDSTGGLEVSESEGDSAATNESMAEEAVAQAEARPATTTEDIAVPSEIFRAYDIRAVFPETVNAPIATLIGRAFGSAAYTQGQNEILVARDGRLSSAELAEAFMEGLESTGRTVTDLGEVPTPVMYFATHFLGATSGAMITGSHNPPQHNGFKLVLRGEALHGESISALRDLVTRKEFVEGKGARQSVDVLGDYWDRIAGDVTIARPLRVVVDAANGVAGKTAPELLRRIGCEPIELYCDIDGNFPNHGPDPSDPANLEALAAMVRMQKADVGIAFDGDGDRLAVVDSTGTIIWPDRLLMLFAKDVLSRSPGADIVFDVKCSHHLPRLITEHAGVPVLWKTGHSLMKAKLQETGALLGGEMSGHLFFNDRWYGFDDGLYAAARLLELLSMDSRSSAEVFADLPNGHCTPELRVPMKEGEPAEFMRLFARKAHIDNAQLTTIDGVRADFGDAWGLVRASNTTPCLTVRFEGDTLEALDRTQELFRAQMLAVRSDLKLPF